MKLLLVLSLFSLIACGPAVPVEEDQKFELGKLRSATSDAFSATEVKEISDMCQTLISKRTRIKKIIVKKPEINKFNFDTKFKGCTSPEATSRITSKMTSSYGFAPLFPTNANLYFPEIPTDESGVTGNLCRSFLDGNYSRELSDTSEFRTFYSLTSKCADDTACLVVWRGQKAKDNDSEGSLQYQLYESELLHLSLTNKNDYELMGLTIKRQRQSIINCTNSNVETLFVKLL